MPRILTHITPAPGGSRQEGFARNATWFLAGAFVSAGILTIVVTREIDEIREDAAKEKAAITERVSR